MNETLTGLDSFIEKYNPIRNTFTSCCAMWNLMYDRYDEEQMDYVEEFNDTNIWSYRDTGELINGLYYSVTVIGYIICSTSWEGKRGAIQYQI